MLKSIKASWSYSLKVIYIAVLSYACTAALGCGDAADASDNTEATSGAGGSSLQEPSSTRDLSDIEGLRLCCVLGAACHPEQDDPPGGTVRLCHELGHSNLPGDCRAQYDECIAACNPSGAEMEHACF